MSKNVNIGIVCIFIFLILIYFGNLLIIPYYDWDVTIYTLVGKGIFDYHILPYDYVFEHKPYLVYVVYYWCDKLIPFPCNKFAILAILSFALTATVFRKLYILKWRNICTFLFLGGAISFYFTGNTEVIQIPLISIVFLTLITAVEKKSKKLFFISTFLSSFVINVNYLSGVIIAPVFIYIFFSRLCTLVEFSLCALGGLTGLLILSFPFLLDDPKKLINYFSTQHHFLHNYSAGFYDRLSTLKKIIINISFLYPALILWFKEKSVFWKNSKNKILTLWFLDSLIAAFMSGHNYEHYSALYIMPGMLICAVLYSEKKIYFHKEMLLFSIYAFVSMIIVTSGSIKQRTYLTHTHPKIVSSIVGKQKVLNIRSDHALYYLANLETFDRFLFIDHIDYYYKKEALQHFLYDLNEKPPFVLTPYRGCEKEVLEKEICDLIHTRYHLVDKAYNPQKPLSVKERYYELYQENIH